MEIPILDTSLLSNKSASILSKIISIYRTNGCHFGLYPQFNVQSVFWPHHYYNTCRACMKTLWWTLKSRISLYSVNLWFDLARVAAILDVAAILKILSGQHISRKTHYSKNIYTKCYSSITICEMWFMHISQFPQRVNKIIFMYAGERLKHFYNYM